MNNCLSTSQLYDRDCLYCISLPNKIFVSGSLSHMIKVWENLKLAMERCKVAFTSKDIVDPSTVFKCTVAGSILVLYWSSTMLYTLLKTSERAAP